MLKTLDQNDLTKNVIKSTSNTLIVGRIGSGKSQIFRKLEESILKKISDDPSAKLVVYDINGFSYKCWPDEEDTTLMFSIVHNKSFFWHIAENLIDDKHIEIFTTSMLDIILNFDKNEYFYNKLYKILKSSILECRYTFGKFWRWKDLSEKLSKYLQESNGYMLIILKELIEVFNLCQEKEYINTNKIFSITEWTKAKIFDSVHAQKSRNDISNVRTVFLVNTETRNAPEAAIINAFIRLSTIMANKNSNINISMNHSLHCY